MVIKHRDPAKEANMVANNSITKGKHNRGVNNRFWLGNAGKQRLQSINIETNALYLSISSVIMH